MTNSDAFMRLRVDETFAASRDLAMLSHDIRCAVQGVTGAAALLEAEAGVAPALRARLACIGEAAMQLNELVEALIAQPAQEAAPSSTVLGAALSRVDRLWSAAAAAAGVRFRIETAPDLPRSVAADMTAVLRILGNLICNAIKHSGGGEVVVAARRGPAGGVTLAVEDRGSGLSAARIAALEAGAAVAPVGGHGLGLAVARALSAELGGALRLTNRPGGGLAAELILPPRLNGAEAPAAGFARIGLAGRRVLLAEDNPTNQLVASQMLRALGAEVTLAGDGVEALERFEEGRFDLLVVDIEMPRLSGLDVIRAVRARGDAKARIPVVALTAYALREHRDRIAAAGANGLISKPLTSIEAFGAALASHLGPALDAVPTEAVSAEEPVADQAVFDALCRAIGQDMMAELLEKVVADLRQARADLAGALSPLDPKPIRAASHILISVAGAVGAVRLQRCARTLNAAAHDEDAEGLPAETRRCMEEIDAAVAFADSRRRAA